MASNKIPDYLKIQILFEIFQNFFEMLERKAFSKNTNMAIILTVLRQNWRRMTNTT